MIELPEAITVTRYKAKDGKLYDTMKEAIDAERKIDNLSLEKDFHANLMDWNPFSLNYGSDPDFSKDLLRYIAEEINELMPYVRRYHKINDGR